jgi:thiamine biosynthesis lipoprotein
VSPAGESVSRSRALRGAALVLVVALALVLYHAATGRTGAGGRPYVERTSVMHTDARVVIVPGAEMTVAPEEAAGRAFAALREVERLMNPYDPESDLARINDAPPGTLVPVDPLTWRVLQEAMRFHRLSGGAFDVTVGPLLRVWRERPGGALPAPDAVRAALRTVGSDRILFEREGMRVGLPEAGMRIDLGAIAKGFGVDRARDALRAAGVRNALIEVGGEIRLMGEVPLETPVTQAIGGGAPSSSPADGREGAAADPGAAPTRPWRTGIRHPRAAEVIETLERTDCAVATSGDYARGFVVDGVRYSHIYDPRTGRALSGGVVSATVISPASCLEADALATAVSVLGLEEGRRLLALFPGVEAILILEEPDGLRKVRLRTPETLEDLAAVATDGADPDAGGAEERIPVVVEEPNL